MLSVFRHFRIWLLFSLLSSASYATQIDTAKSWISSEVNSGMLSQEQNVSSNTLALAAQSAKEVALAFYLFDDETMLDTQMLLSPFVHAKDENTTEYLSSYITTHSLMGNDVSTKVQSLLSFQNLDGGFGHDDSHQSTLLDTAVALEAFFYIGSNESQIGKAIDYLLLKQFADGSWQDVDGDNLYITSLVLRSLWLHRKFHDVQAAIDKAKEYLLSHKNADGSYGNETFISALALRAIAPLEYDKTELQVSIDYLYSTQETSGFWEEDIYTTALVLQALRLADKEVPNPDLGVLSGMVVDGDSGIALSGLVVQLDGDSNVITDSDGRFAFSGLVNKTYTINVLSSNHAPLHTSVRMVGDDVDLGVLRLNKNINSTISILRGVVKDQETGEALGGATISIGMHEATTANDGSYTIDTIEAGSYTITVAKSGYLQEIRNINVPANTILNYDVLLRDFSFEVSVNIGATIIDKNTSLPLENVNISLSGEGISKNFITLNDGVFEFSNISQGTYSLQISKSGYYQVQTTFTVNSSQNVNFGIVRLVPIDSNTSTFATVQGRITDRFSKEAIENARIDISGLTVYTGSDGTYSIDTVPIGDINLTVSKDGYQSVIGNASVTAGSTLIFSPSLQEIDGNLKLYGTILDSNSSEPLVDVNITILNEENATTFTDMNGTYLIDGIPVGDITIKVEKFGYRTVTITTNVSDKSIEFSPTLQRNTTTNNQTIISGNVVDAASKESLVGVAFYVNGVDTGIRSDSDGNFTIENIAATDINLTLKYANYKDVNSIIYLDVAQEINIGTLHMRSIAIEEYKPDLVVEAINTSGITNDISTLAVNGELNITVANRGTISSDAFEIVVFYDSNADGNYTQGVDRNFVSHRVEGIDIDGSKVVSLDINTTADFRDQAIYVYVDSRNENVELDENNTYSTAKSCGGKQGQVDLGICFDYSGSVGSLANLQKNGLIQALRDPTKFPRDGSIRLTIMTVQRTQLEPTIITNDNAESIADNMSNTYFYGSSYVDDCLKVMSDKLDALPNQSAYKAVTLSGDGYWGGGVASDRDYAISKGINVVDAIAVGNSLNWSTLNAIVYPQPVGGELGVVYRATTAEEVSNSLVSTFKKQTQIADLTLGKLKIIDNGTEQNISIKFTIGNAGVATIPSDINISVYEGDPKDGGVLLAATTLDENLSFGESRVIEMTNIALQEGGEIYVIGDVDNHLVECTKENNSISSIVSPTSTLGNIDTDTDKISYTANEIVFLSANITNPGRLSYDLTAQLILQDSNGNIIQTFAPQPLGIVVSNDSRIVSNEWNTTDSITGVYVLRGILTDTWGNVVSESNSTFNIVSEQVGNVSAILNLSTDRVRYRTTDSITINSFVESVSSNTIIDEAKVVVEIRDSNGTIVNTATLHMGDLLPLSSRDVPNVYGYNGLLTGEYHIKAALYGKGNTLFAIDSKTITVYEDLSQALKGSVDLAWNNAPAGTAQTCSYSLTQFGSTYLDPQPYALRIIDMNNGSIEDEHKNNVTLESAQTYTGEHHFSTHAYKKKLFSCGLYVNVKDKWVLLDHKLFTLTNVAPIAENDSIVTDENTKVVIDVLENDNDEEGSLDSSTIAIVTAAKHGSVTVINGKILYTPQINYSGEDTFYYTVKDKGGLLSNRAKVDIVINNSYEPPKAENDSIVTDENTKVVIDVLENDNDEEGSLDDSTITIVTTAKHGSVTVINGKIQYTPQINYSGEDTFSYRVKDSEGLISNIAKVTIVINNSNEAPKAENQKLTTLVNRHLDIMLTGSDPDGNALKYTIMTYPNHGTLSSSLPNVLYVPNIDYVGNDYFTFKVNDTAVDSNIAIVNIAINKEPVLPPTNPCGCTPTSLPIDLNVPTRLKVSAITGNSAVLSWNDNSDNELFFVIYVNGKAVTVVGANTTSYTLRDLDPETSYVFHIKVYGENVSLDSKELIFQTGNLGWLPAIYHIVNFK